MVKISPFWICFAIYFAIYFYFNRILEFLKNYFKGLVTGGSAPKNYILRGGSPPHLPLQIIFKFILEILLNKKNIKKVKFVP